ncbi:glucanase B [Colletotrichum plurivorum]|uniref:Glucanase B n=1 Tax=Colletotrichum plurivorum TaxID=2175906 RepID=A0A8H6KRP9_9PEZI|nr:glucanase B [Colletotrichum plurivorum]
MQPSLFDGYFQPYVNAVWDRYRSADLTINTQAQWGDVKGRVGSDNLLTFGDVGSFTQPSARDIFSCSTGPFGGYPKNQAEMGAIGARIAAAFNRSTLLTNDQQPQGERVDDYYRDVRTNHYSRICHEVSPDGRGYAFPYDDVELIAYIEAEAEAEESLRRMKTRDDDEEDEGRRRGRRGTTTRKTRDDGNKHNTRDDGNKHNTRDDGNKHNTRDDNVRLRIPLDVVG